MVYSFSVCSATAAEVRIASFGGAEIHTLAGLKALRAFRATVSPNPQHHPSPSLGTDANNAIVIIVVVDAVVVAVVVAVTAAADAAPAAVVVVLVVLVVVVVVAAVVVVVVVVVVVR